MNVYWLEQAEADVAPELEWLSAAERARLRTLRFPKRRADWLLGRWTAKQAVAAWLHVPGWREALAGIEIRAAPDGAPEAFFAAERAAITISLSHRAGVSVCAVAPAGVKLGCDVEAIEPRSDAFLADYFTAEEHALIAGARAAERSRLLTLLWSGKESALKALRAGLRLDTRAVSASPDRAEAGGWRPLRVSCAAGEVFDGWWYQAGGLVRTVVAAPAPARPPIVISALSHPPLAESGALSSAR